MEGQEQGIARIEEFLDLYKQLEDALEVKYRESRRHSTSVVFDFIRDEESAPVRDQLDLCREIRNLLTHNANLGGEPVVTPSAPVMESLREVLEYVKRPPMAMEFATKGDRLLKANLDQKVLRLMETMDKNGYSHVPVMREGIFYGVFSAGSVFRYQLKNRGAALTPETTLRDLEAYLSVGEHTENYEFVPRDATYLSVRRKFETVRGKNKRVSVIFITETGKPGQKLLGMLTPWDVLGE